MPKQIISDVFGELLETGKKTGQQLKKLPTGIVEEAAQQTGVKPKTEEQKGSEAKIQKLKEEDEKKKAKDIAFVKNQLAEYQKPPPPALVSVDEQQTQRKSLAPLVEKKKELPPLIVGRKQTRVEATRGAGG